MHLLSSAEKTPHRIRTSLEEKYAKLNKTATAVPSASASRTEEQQDAVEQHAPMITVVGALHAQLEQITDFLIFLEGKTA